MQSNHLALTVGLAAETVREDGPVVHCLAPREATAFVADVLHAAGARAVITGTTGGGLAAAATADALALDLATLSADWSDAVGPALARAQDSGTPWVLDATKLGRAPLRADLLATAAGHRPSVVRADEVDRDAMDGLLTELALITADHRVLLDGGALVVPAMDAMLAQTPGFRAAATALVAACAAVAPAREAAIAGAAWMALASERAGGERRGPARYRMAFLDELWTIHGDEIAEYLHLG
ncbi:MAG: hydroxyethylthiazole kinase [Propioniciclava sp.]|uniref:hydroxyethylthiazole kinase n=1 Tax=Propioniciclava sp. TaxID=2038686 RepID=UPI0039E25D3C